MRKIRIELNLLVFTSTLEEYKKLETLVVCGSDRDEQSWEGHCTHFCLETYAKRILVQLFF